MRLSVIAPTFLALALFSNIPASTQSHAMNLGAGGPTVERATTDDGLIILAATVRNPSRAAIEKCHHVKNRHQRTQCLHMHGVH
jgi:hypothetical protein